MKKLFLWILFVFLFASCSNTPTKVDDPKKETTIEIQQLAAIDTICYKVVELNDKIYIIQNDLVVKSVANQTGTVYTCICIIVCLIVFLSIIGVTKTSN